MQLSTHHLDSVVLQLHTAKTLGSMPVLGIPLRTSKLLASINEASGGKLQLAIVPAMTGMDYKEVLPLRVSQHKKITPLDTQKTQFTVFIVCMEKERFWMD